MVAAIGAVHDDPSALAAELERGAVTVIHGDLNLRNIALTDDAVILLDWALCAAAPAEVDYAFYITSWFLTQTSREQVIADCRAAAGARWDGRSWELALIGQLAWDGQFLSVLAVDHPVEAVRQFARGELTWWVDRVRLALETWSPV